MREVQRWMFAWLISARFTHAHPEPEAATSPHCIPLNTEWAQERFEIFCNTNNAQCYEVPPVFLPITPTTNQGSTACFPSSRPIKASRSHAKTAETKRCVSDVITKTCRQAALANIIPVPPVLLLMPGYRVFQFGDEMRHFHKLGDGRLDKFLLTVT